MKNTKPLLAMSIFNLADLEAAIRRYRQLGADDETKIGINFDSGLRAGIILEDLDSQKIINFYGDFK